MRPFLPLPLGHRTLRSISLLSTLFASTAKETKMSTPNIPLTPSKPPSYTTRSYTPPNPPPNNPFPYNVADMTPMDSGNDASFYSQARFVTHIDDNAVKELRGYYDVFLPKRGTVLDFCSSWISHYPKGVEEGVERGELVVLGTGMNGSEMGGNEVLSGDWVGDGERKGMKRWVVQDLNVDMDVRLPEGWEGVLDAATCVVSIDYLTRPVEVLESIRGKMRVGGMVHLVISNRCFPTKVVGRWLKVGEEERLEMVGDYLWWSGWREVEILEVVKSGGWLKDPLWVVRGKNLMGGG